MKPVLERVFSVGFRSAIVLGCLVGDLSAEITMPPNFGDHMVLQQGMTLPVWGDAAPGEHVKVLMGGQSSETLADKSGKWRVILRPFPPSFSPQTLVIEGENRIELNDVLLGDVWIAAGEGNMKLRLADAVGGKDSDGATTDRGLRFFMPEERTSLQPEDHGRGKWVVCTGESALSFSAVGYFFARDLRSACRLPMGIIQCAVDDAPAQAWISREGLSVHPSFSGYLTALSSRCINSKPSELPDQKTPSVLFNAMINPLIPFAMTGVIWYQGESNEGLAALEYRRLFPRLIRDWRTRWGQGAFPFYFVLPAGYGSPEGADVESLNGADGHAGRGLPWLREGILCATTLPNTAVASAVDLGDSDDRYPVEKLDVGRRLALLARKRVYGEQIVDSGPVFRGMHPEERKLRVWFDRVGGGLTIGVPPCQRDELTRNPGTRINGFSLSGKDGKWFPAQGKIEGASVLLSSDAVPYPEEVRYDWKGFPAGNLYNREGLPALPFRTDTRQPE